MNIQAIVRWLDERLQPEKFHDVANNGLQIARTAPDTARVAFAVDASVDALERAAQWGAGLCVVHHGISWGGGIRRLTGSEYAVVRTAIRRDLALYASHLPLDAHPLLGNNAQLAAQLGLSATEPAFVYHGNTIGLVGRRRDGALVGVCSGGAGEFAVEAHERGCAEYVTGEASWGDVVAAENIGMKMTCLGHYETETGGVRALAEAMAAELAVETRFFARKEESR